MTNSSLKLQGVECTSFASIIHTGHLKPFLSTFMLGTYPMSTILRKMVSVLILSLKLSSSCVFCKIILFACVEQQSIQLYYVILGSSIKICSQLPFPSLLTFLCSCSRALGPYQCEKIGRASCRERVYVLV